MELWFVAFLKADKSPGVEKIMAATAHAAILKWNEMYPELPGKQYSFCLFKE